MANWPYREHSFALTTTISPHHLQGDYTRPIITVTPTDPSGEKKTKFVIRLHPYVHSSVFKVRHDIA